MTPFWRWILGVALALFIAVTPYVYFRAVYAHGKRLREVEAGRLYRSGQLTVEGLTEAVRRFHLRTIINVQEDVPDPALARSYFDHHTERESELCRELGVRYVMLAPDVVPSDWVPDHRPQAIEKFLALMDRPETYPALIHCKAGLHRTGVLTAVYRMEYQGWTPYEAVRELKENGFGCLPCTSANEYVRQYILTFRRGLRESTTAARPHTPKYPADLHLVLPGS